jgi:hypothetical protein
MSEHNKCTVFSDTQLDLPWVIVSIFVVGFTLVGIGIVSDSYFIESVMKISRKLDLSGLLAACSIQLMCSFERK